MKALRAMRGSARLAAVMMLALLPYRFGEAQIGAPTVQPGAAATQREAAKQQEEGPAAAAQRQVTQPLNNAPVWRDVRSGDINAYQTTQVRGPETNVLIQTEGEIWRRIRNGPITIYGGWLIV